MERIGCTSCHIADLSIEDDRRVADVETTYAPEAGGLNGLFAEAAGRFVVENDDSGYPALKRPAGGSFVVRDIFSDFKRHDLGPAFWETNYDGTVQKEFLTEPLWGVGSTAPYGHDGRSINLHEVILRHGGEAQQARDGYAALNPGAQGAITAFLETLVLFPPPDTASNLDPADPHHPDYPRVAHGSIDLSVLFNDPDDKE